MEYKFERRKYSNFLSKANIHRIQQIYHIETILIIRNLFIQYNFTAKRIIYQPNSNI